MRKVIAGLLTVLLIAGGIAGVGLLFRLGEKVGAARSQWPTVRGTITSSRADSTSTPEPSITLDYMTVRFTYQVGGVRYSGTQDWPGGRPKDESTYSPGATVTVYFVVREYPLAC